MKTRKIYFALILLAILTAIYALGPKPETPTYNNHLAETTYSVSTIDSVVRYQESELQLRKNNEAQIVWADSIGKPSEYVILYLPGFSATRMEGNPTHRDIARKIGANLFLSRLDFHGFEDSRFDEFTAEGIWNSAKEQLAIAENLGQKVIVMGTSTGATLGLMLAAKFPDKVYALVNLSPNIRVNNAAAFLLNDPWGSEIATLVFGGEGRQIKHKQEEAKLYWDTIYPVSAVVQLQELLETAMVDSTFQKVTCPALTLYYYKDEKHQDAVVDASYIPKMHEALGTPAELKVIKALPEPEDHVIGSSIKSKNYRVVEDEILLFCKNTLQVSN